MTAGVGTPEYMAPELLMRQEYGVGVDWWTLGCLLFEMVVGRSPFAGDDLKQLVHDITTIDPSIPRRVSPECERLIRRLLARDPDARLDGAGMRTEPFYEGFDWDALLRMEIPAPYVPTAEALESDLSSHSEQRDRLQAEFGDEWTSRASDDAPIAAQPSIGEGTATSALALELTADGTIWRITGSLSKLLGFAPAQAHELFGYNLLKAAGADRPCVDPESKPAFVAAFDDMLQRLRAVSGNGGEIEPTRGVIHRPVCVLRPGDRPPVHLAFAFEETAKLTEHSVALMPTSEAHAAITITFADVSRAEEVKLLVRRRLDLSFNERADDNELARIFAPDFAISPSSTRMPARAGALSKPPIDRYLERRALLVRAFPDLRCSVVDQTCSDSRVVTSWAWSGTHNGPLHFEVDGQFVDIAPTGRRVQMTGVAFDVFRGDLLVDLAAYYDASDILRQVREADSGAVLPRCDAPEGQDVVEEGADDESKLSPEQIASKQLMERFYKSKVLTLLATACNDLGFAICRRDAQHDLPVAISSVGFARALGLAGDRAGLDLKLLHHLRANAMISIQPDALGAVDALRSAATSGNALTELVTLGRSDRPQALIVNIAPFTHEGLELVAVLIVDVNADPRNQGGAVLADADTEAESAASHYTWHHGLLDNLSAQPGAHLGFGYSVLSAAVDAFHVVGFSLAPGNVPGLPMKWVSEGFLKLTGYTRAGILNYNCNRLQCEATDPDACFRLGNCIRTGTAERVMLWNITRQGKGFWNCLSMYPSLSDAGRVVNYCVATQVRMDTPFYRRLVRNQRTVKAIIERTASVAASA
mmetsp:Transcript_2813/g.8228  ORF Transcript_2813/g.8228 Transcript_2813/m.8228 type:complete len:818 (-) Transcript_2813:459-2912(-)